MYVYEILMILSDLVLNSKASGKLSVPLNVGGFNSCIPTYGSIYYSAVLSLFVNVLCVILYQPNSQPPIVIYVGIGSYCS